MANHFVLLLSIIFWWLWAPLIYADDSHLIKYNIQKSYPTGMISLEHITGRLLLNPDIRELRQKKFKEQFILSSMVIDQHKGLRLVKELPMRCFCLPSFELAKQNYKHYRQHDMVLHLLDKEKFPVTHVLMCSLADTSHKHWKKALEMQENNNFVFSATESDAGEKFYYYVDEDGFFEMYIKT